MEIKQIKSRLKLSEVLRYYGLKPDRNNRLRCPFHEDRTPSLQIYYKTHTCYCFSTACPTHGHSLDVIDFIMHMEKCSKHEAILKSKSLITGSAIEASTAQTISPSNPSKRITVLTQIFTYFKNGVHNSQPAKDYLKKRGLDYTKTEVGYNSGQFHHGKRKAEKLIKSCIEYGILIDLGIKSRTGNPAYKPFGKWGIVFPLRNENYDIVGLYFRSTLSPPSGGAGGGNQRHFYLKNRQGLYPNYPDKDSKKLILTESIIDAATLLEQDTIKNQYAVLALYGTNGLGEEHQKAISDWVTPPSGGVGRGKEVIFFLNGDAAGEKAIEKYAPMLKTDYPKLKVSQVEVPENEDVNSLLQGHSSDILLHLIRTRKEYGLFLSSKNERTPIGAEVRGTSGGVNREAGGQALNESTEEPQQTGLDTNNPYNLKYKGKAAHYQIKGFKTSQLDSLKITLQIAVS